MGMAVKLMLAVVIAALVFVAGCVALVGFGVDEGSPERRPRAISSKEARRIEPGTSKGRVLKKLGTPEGTENPCIYYRAKGGGTPGRWEFCFTRDRLKSKDLLK